MGRVANSSAKSKGLLGPLKKLAQKLNNDEKQISALLDERRDASMKVHIHSLVKVSSFIDEINKIESFLAKEAPSSYSTGTNRFFRAEHGLN